MSAAALMRRSTVLDVAVPIGVRGYFAFEATIVDAESMTFIGEVSAPAASAGDAIPNVIKATKTGRNVRHIPLL